uniref:Transcriptional regulator, TetR family n=1 Tax=Caulobacter sp. (strain K31) TaxID=366602 RepID=B0T952_CAUSK
MTNHQDQTARDLSPPRQGVSLRTPGAMSVTKARLMRAATDLFYEQGVRAVSIDDIVAAADVTKPTLYRLFASKDALLTACVAADSIRLCAELEEVIEQAPANPVDQVAAVARHYAEAMRAEHHRGILAANVAVEFPDPDHPVRAVVAQATARFHARLGELLAPLAGPASGAAASHLVLVILGACNVRQALGGPVAADALLCAVDSVMACVAERAKAAPAREVVWV